MLRQVHHNKIDDFLFNLKRMSYLDYAKQKLKLCPRNNDT